MLCESVLLKLENFSSFQDNIKYEGRKKKAWEDYKSEKKMNFLSLLILLNCEALKSFTVNTMTSVKENKKVWLKRKMISVALYLKV